MLTCLGNVHLDRVEALRLLKELIALGTVQPTFVSVEQNKEGTFSLTLKVDGNLPELKAFLNCRKMLFSEDIEKGTCTINTASK